MPMYRVPTITPTATIRRKVGRTLVGLAVVSAAGCSGPASVFQSKAVSPTRSPSTPPTTIATTTTAPPTTVALPPPEQVGWTVVSQTPTAIVTDERTVIEPSGASVVIGRFRVGATKFDLHVGSEDPPAAGASLPPDAASSVSPTERPLLLGGFNGGFKAATGDGGIEVAGQVIGALVPGLASVVIYADGSAAIGIWDQTVPKAGQVVVSVRQNLSPLVEDGGPSAEIQTISAWGATLGGGSSVARSALGEDAAGNLLYAGSESARPADMADALVTAGATVAMELDINPYWVQLDLAATPGGPLTALIPGQTRPADQYLSGWSRDFFTVLATA